MFSFFRTKKHLRLSTCFSAMLFLVFILLIDIDLALPCLIAAAFHECGHLLVAKILQIPIRELKLDLFGARISVSSGLISYHAEFLLCAAGPFFSLLLSGGLWLFPAQEGFLISLRDASLFLGLLNLLPVRGFDGGRMVASAFALLFSERVSSLISDLLTGVFLILLWGISVYLLLVFGGGLSLFVFSAGMFVKVFLA